MAEWRAIQVKPLAEFWVAHGLDRDRVVVWVPELRPRARRHGAVKWRVPLFPGYVLADLEDVPPGLIRRSPGVIRVVGSLPIPDQAIAALRARAAQGFTDLKAGKLYRLHRPGALGELLVRLERLDDRGRAVVLVQIFGTEREVTVQRDELEPDG